MTPDFTRTALQAGGFSGWVPFVSLIAHSNCPDAGGAYVVVCAPCTLPEFAPISCGGAFKGRNPAVSADALAANWVPGAEVLYIGKADNLRRRLRQFADFGAGKPVGHWGGRLIWQLSDPASLLVAWKETPADVPYSVEQALIARFRERYGKPPFANDPHRLGR